MGSLYSRDDKHEDLVKGRIFDKKFLKDAADNAFDSNGGFTGAYSSEEAVRQCRPDSRRL